MNTLGSLIAELLKERGIDLLFGIPGVHTIELYRGLHSSGLRHITPRHEQGAGFMADGYARATGRVAACLVITGPGVTNIATAVAQAYSDSVPMLIISSVNRQDELGLGEGRLHELPDQQALMHAVCAESHHLARIEELPTVLDLAMQVFSTGRPRPVHVQIPIDLLEQPLPAGWRPPAPRVRQPAPVVPEGIREAAGRLQRAKKPLMILGGGARDAARVLPALLQKLPIPVVLTIAGKGLLPPDHPCLIGSCLPTEPVQQALREADLLLAVGTELSETDSLRFAETLRLGGDLIRIDLDPQQFHRRPVTDLAIHASAAAALEALMEHLSVPAVWLRKSHLETCARLRDAAFRSIPRSSLLHGKLLEYIDAVLPDAVLVGDSTQPIYGANLSFNARTGRSYFNSTTGYGTLGYALPAAIGASLGRPDAQPVCIIGDGGLQFSLPELMVARELRIPLIVVIWKNDGYEEIRRAMLEKQVVPVGVKVASPDLADLAAAYGCSYRNILNRSDLEAELVAAGQRDLPSLLEMNEAVTLDWLAQEADSEQGQPCSQ